MFIPTSSLLFLGLYLLPIFASIFIVLSYGSRFWMFAAVAMFHSALVIGSMIDSTILLKAFMLGDAAPRRFWIEVFLWVVVIIISAFWCSWILNTRSKRNDAIADLDNNSVVLLLMVNLFLLANIPLMLSLLRNISYVRVVAAASTLAMSLGFAFLICRKTVYVRPMSTIAKSLFIFMSLVACISLFVVFLYQARSIIYIKIMPLWSNILSPIAVILCGMSCLLTVRDLKLKE